MSKKRRWSRRLEALRTWGVYAGMGAAVVLAVALGYLAMVVTPQQDAERARAAAAVAPTVQPTIARTVGVSVVGDSFTAGNSFGGLDTANWVSVANRSMPADAGDASWKRKGLGGAGYVQIGTAGQTLSGAIDAAAQGDTTLWVFFGSYNDRAADPEAVRSAAVAAFAQAKAKTPDAKILVVGPAWPHQGRLEEIAPAADAVAQAAAESGAAWVDAREWFAGKPELISEDGVHPNDAGHEYLASMIGPHIEAMLKS